MARHRTASTPAASSFSSSKAQPPPLFTRLPVPLSPIHMHPGPLFPSSSYPGALYVKHFFLSALCFFFFIYSVPPYLLIHLQGQLFLLVAQARNLGIILGDSLSLPRPVCQICGLFLQVLVSSTLPPWPEPPPRPGYSQ